MTHLNKTYLIHTDGGARGNPGPAASAFVVRDASGAILHEQGYYLGETTNNMAEYQAVVYALEWLVASCEPAVLQFHLDSALVVNQLKGLFRVKEPRFVPLIDQIFTLIKQGNFKATFTAIPRAQNQAADALVNQTLDARLE